jgi:DNA-binding MarR family transcriptional regulator
VARSTLSTDDYRQLLRVRTGLRRFLRWSEDRANEAGLTGPQHQLLLAIKGHDDARGPTVGDIAGYLALKHHSAVGLIDRADAAGLVARRNDPDDHRVVRLRLTARGGKTLATLSTLHREELRRLAPEMQAIWRNLAGFDEQPGRGRPL